MKYLGGCHCQSVRFEVNLADEVDVEDCNCSICSKSGFLHLIVPKAHFRLLTPKNNLSCYTFNTGVAKHYFCKQCGVKSFYIPRSNPDGVDVNLRCLDKQPPIVNINKFDGQNWEDNAASLAHKSRI
ncbi:GFA family protein [Catenovulum sp. SM1970]|uniref:GFA family protein n=1 Tax=Marinifaba aquimaris TaxID=2741323 RepID=UPI0015742C90|nr:GFA family protein [Marinifaba aquimaris]NTS78621.1 GFA family protein [Marinifaba aquimaris]